MSDRQFERSVRDWLEDGSDRTPPAAIQAVLFAVKTTPQQRDLGILRRYNPMPSYLRYAAAAAIVAVIGVGALTYFGSGPDVGTEPTPSPSVTAATPGPASSQVAPEKIRWTEYTSVAYPMTLGVPEDWTLEAAATRRWQSGDRYLGVDEWPYAEVFTSPDEESVGLFVWEVPAGEGVDVETHEGLKSWAETFCNDVGLGSCEEFARSAKHMCLNEGGDSCRGAILVPAAGQQYAFFVNWASAMLTNSPDRVRVVLVARPDEFPSAARYGGSVALLKSILTTMNVWPLGYVPPAT